MIPVLKIFKMMKTILTNYNFKLKDITMFDDYGFEKFLDGQNFSRSVNLIFSIMVDNHVSDLQCFIEEVIFF